MGFGLLVIIVSTLQLASAGYGGHAKQQFAERRSYNMVKEDVHRRFPMTIVQGLAGLGLMIWGHHRRARVLGRRDLGPHDQDPRDLGREGPS